MRTLGSHCTDFSLVTYRLVSRQNNERCHDGTCTCQPYGQASGGRQQHRQQDVPHRLQKVSQLGQKTVYVRRVPIPKSG
jgi:hypothetical protein